MMNKLHTSQTGMVSLLVSLIMMIVISLVVIGFSQLARNEVSQTLNRQLSTEAFYAANSGLNNVSSIINNDINTNQFIASQTQHCTIADDGINVYNNNPLTSVANSAVAGQKAIDYSCVYVNPDPPAIAEKIASGGFVAFPFELTSGNFITSMTFSWNNESGGTSYTCPTIGTLKQEQSWPASCDSGLLQVDLVSGTDSQSLTTEESGSYALFLYPRSGGSTLPQNLNAADNDGFFPASCSGTTCVASINVPSSTQTLYYVGVYSVYEPTNLTVCADTTCDVPLSNAQAQIDVTGRAQGVLQRLSATKQLSSISGVPFAIVSGDSLCKLIEGHSSSAASGPGTVIPITLPANAPGNLSSTSYNESCNLN